MTEVSQRLLPAGRATAPALALVCALTTLPDAALSQSLEGLTWSAQKCVLYDSALTEALQMLGRGGIRDDFLARNAEFIAGGCQANTNICPETAREVDLVNLLTVMTMNEGMASTFVPFGCPDGAG